MDEFVELVDVLRARIEAHAGELRKNEALTRAALVDPLLRGLGWDTEDPAQVVPEFSIPDHKAMSADYALFVGAERPHVIVEAKKLGTPLAEAAKQALSYCTQDGFPFFAVTDGQSWYAYETLRPGNLEAKRVATFDLCSGATAEIALIALVLWRPRFVSSVGVEATAHATALPVGVSAPAAPPVSQPNPGIHVGAPQPKLATMVEQPSLGGAWVPLATFEAQAHTKPQELRLPSGDIVAVSAWREIPGRVVEYLSAHGKLLGDSVPIQIGKKYVVSTKAIHSDGTPFTSPLKAGPFFLETNYSAKTTVSNSRTIIERAGLHASTFALRVKGG